MGIGISRRKVVWCSKVVELLRSLKPHSRTGPSYLGAFQNICLNAQSPSSSSMAVIGMAYGEGHVERKMKQYSSFSRTEWG